MGDDVDDVEGGIAAVGVVVGIVVGTDIGVVVAVVVAVVAAGGAVEDTHDPQQSTAYDAAPPSIYPHPPNLSTRSDWPSREPPWATLC